MNTPQAQNLNKGWLLTGFFKEYAKFNPSYAEIKNKYCIRDYCAVEFTGWLILKSVRECTTLSTLEATRLARRIGSMRS